MDAPFQTSAANEICPFLGFYAAQNGNSLPTFRDNVPVSSSRVKHSEKNLHHSSPTAGTLKMGLIGCHETSLRNYRSALRKIREERRSQISWSFSNLRPLRSHGSEKDNKG